MRSVSLMVMTAALAGCSTAPEPERSAKQEAHFQELIAGKVAGAPLSCLPSYRSRDNMVVVDDNTLVFRDGRRRVYVNHIVGGCNNLSSGFYALVTRQYGGMGMCRGDIAEVADLTSGSIVGSCSLGDFIPYTSAAR
ncbi:MAG: DUF6491 family protein [Sphingomicrobium sp.]